MSIALIIPNDDLEVNVSMSVNGKRQLQTLDQPLESLDQVRQHLKILSESLAWDDTGILTDEGHRSTLILLLVRDQVSAVFRMNLSDTDSAVAIELVLPNKGTKVTLRCSQGAKFTQKEIRSLQDLQRIWEVAADQSKGLSSSKVRVFFKKLSKDSKTKGRGKGFSASTKKAVMLYSHGRCMFEGCGEDLQLEELTGTAGNFSYLAHNVASAEKGPRGIKLLSEELSDDPKNVLLLCDKHHRLVDKIAAADYPADVLSKMRRDYGVAVKKLLRGLKYQPIPAFSILWPVHGAFMSAPSDLEISQCLEVINCRLFNEINDLSNNESTLRDLDIDRSWTILPESVEMTASKILQQAEGRNYKAGLFAIGLMPALIALGAKLGNKNNIIPMLRYRDGNKWVWPSEKPKGRFYNVLGEDGLSQTEKEVVLVLALTGEPNNFSESCNNIGAKIVTIRAHQDVMGNGSLAHPDDGFLFAADMQKLLHKLKNDHGVERIHLLPCASNAACVFFGMSFDNYHPEIQVYDFYGTSMKPRIIISSEDQKCEVKAV